MSQGSSFTPYLVLGGTILGAIVAFVAFVVFGYLLIRYVIHKSSNVLTIEISDTMIFYIVLEVLCGFWLCTYLGYISIGWRYTANHYSGYIIFILGSFQVLCLASRPVTVFFLGLDRIMCILFPFHYVEKKRKLPVVGTIIIIFIFTVITLATRIIAEWPQTDETTCSNFGCMTSAKSGEIYNIQRFICSGGNLVLGILLIALVSKKLKNESTVKVGYITVKLVFLIKVSRLAF